MGNMARLCGLAQAAVVLGTLACFLGGLAQAAPEGEQEAVQALLAPDEAGARAEPSDPALAALLLDPGYDAWWLVEFLLASGRQDVAIQLARLVDEDVFGRLLGYAQAPTTPETSLQRVRALQAALNAYAAEDPAELDRRVDSARSPAGSLSVCGVAALTVRGDRFLQSGSTVQALETWLSAGEEALRLGWWSQAQGQFSRCVDVAYAASSLELAARACEGVRAVLEIQGEAHALAGAEFNLGAIAQARGDLPGALRHYDEALSLYETLGESAEVASVRSPRSYLLAELGAFVEALEEQRLLAEYFADRERDGAWADNQLMLGLLRYRLGDGAGASTALTQALEAFHALGLAHGEAQAFGNLGLTHQLEGRWEEAYEVFKSAAQRLTGVGAFIEAANATMNMADSLRHGVEASRFASLGEVDESVAKSARETLERARDLVSGVLPELKNAGAAAALCVAQLTMGEILMDLGQLDEAKALLQATRDEAGRLQAWSSQLSATVALARLALLQQDWTAAIREARGAADELTRGLSGLAESDLARARALVPDVYDIGISAAHQARRIDDLAYFLEAGRASALLRGLGGRAAALRAAVPKALMQKLTEATRAKVAAFAEWQRARATGVRDEVAKGWAAYDAQRQAEKRVLDETLRVQALASNRLAPSRLASIRDLQSRLRPSARPGTRQVFVHFNFQRRDALALVVEPTAARVVTYPRETVPALRAALAELGSSRIGEMKAETIALARSLLIDPLQLPKGATRLHVCPDRDLAYVPVAVLVADDWEVVSVPSATTLDLLAERRLRRGKGVLGLGDPDYSEVPDPDVLATRGGPRLVPLPGTRAEVEAITGNPEDRRLLSAEATESGLAQALAAADTERPWQSVHFACHGLVDVELPALSCLAITPGGGEDGFLMSHEILRLDLRSDLSVLSACQTGRGKFVRGEGVMGLMRAFMFAGAPRVIVSLWEVDDAATSFLMRTFYKEWTQGRETSEALRRAQLAVRDFELPATDTKPASRPWSDPKFWGAWVLWGLPD